MKTVRSYVCGGFHEADSGFVTLVDPSTEEAIARVSSRGIDFAAVLAHARERGGPALRTLTFAERGQLLKVASQALREHRDELLELSRVNTGTTRADGAFDIDGATGTLAYYAVLGRKLGERTFLAEGDGVQLARSEAFWGQHLLVPRQGVAVAINAFNFPAWGFAEKTACALLSGVPVVAKPATATALVAARCAEILAASRALPEGAFQMICGGTGDLLDRLGSQDVLAFTGSAATAEGLRGRPNLLAASTRVNIEADSLNAAVLAPEVPTSGPTYELFLRDVVREMTQKTGQKCTAVRRILVPSRSADDVQEALARRLGEVVTGNPADASVTMGPLATAQQLADAGEGVSRLLGQAVRAVVGSGTRRDGVGSPSGKGFFFPPTLLRADDAGEAEAVHHLEVFAPVATLLPYDGSAAGAAELVARADGTLVTSVYGDDGGWVSELLARAGASTGRLYWGSAASAEAAPGSGIALPQCLHGGPGRAGGGAELGGRVGLDLYLQRVALQGSRRELDALAGTAGEG